MKNISAHLIAEDSRGNILLTQRSDVPVWVIPGGHLENGESPREAAIREFSEEVGVGIEKVKLIARYYSEKDSMTKYLFSARIIKDVILKRSSETRNIGWFECKQLPKPMTLYEKRKIDDYLVFGKKTVSRSDWFDRKEELLNQLRDPLTFIWLLLYFTKNQLTSRSFKV